MKLPYQNALFVKSITHIKQAPHSQMEVAFAGRSNCGKSSLINALTNQKKIAKVSKTPGRTREINFFALLEDKYIVDLPGYGFAKVNRQMQQDWQRLLESYLNYRDALKMVYILMDSRHLLTPLDQALIEFCLAMNIPFSVVATKSDQVNQSERAKISKTLKNFINQKYHMELEHIFITSSLKKNGFDDLLSHLDEVLNFNSPK